MKNKEIEKFIKALEKELDADKIIGITVKDEECKLAFINKGEHRFNIVFNNEDIDIIVKNKRVKIDVGIKRIELIDNS